MMLVIIYPAACMICGITLVAASFIFVNNSLPVVSIEAKNVLIAFIKALIIDGIAATSVDMICGNAFINDVSS